MGLHLPHILSRHVSHSDDPHAAQKKKEYVFEHEPIGAGGYSQVLKAHWKARGGMVVAMKVVKKESIKDRESYLKLVDCGFHRINQHPNICAGLDWFETPHKYYITFPLLTGGELLERLNTRGRFTEDATRRVLKTILRTLDFIHSHGIIHRDIKPDNFLYRTPESEIDDVVLIDFGISKVLDTESEEDVRDQHEAGGTPGYAAPEVFCGMAYGKTSDVFGAGVITYNLLSAWSPWESRDIIGLIQETTRATVNFPPEPFAGVSDKAKGFVKTLMQPPSRRPTAKKALQHEWLAEPCNTPEKDHVLAAQETGDTAVEPIQPLPTLKPDHPIARQLTANPTELTVTMGELH